MLVAGRGGRQSITKGMAKWKGTEITRDISQSSGQFRLATAVLFPLWSTLFIDLFFDFFFIPVSPSPCCSAARRRPSESFEILSLCRLRDRHRPSWGEPSLLWKGGGGRRLTLNEKETTKDDDDHQTI